MVLASSIVPAAIAASSASAVMAIGALRSSSSPVASGGRRVDSYLITFTGGKSQEVGAAGCTAANVRFSHGMRSMESVRWCDESSA